MNENGSDSIVWLDPRMAKILVVDDDVIVGRSVQRSLRSHDVTLVYSGLNALEKMYSGEQYDVIISDMMMPEMTGADFHSAVHSFSVVQAQKMIFMSGYVAPQLRSFLEDKVLIYKPFTPNTLYDAIGCVLGASSVPSWQ